MKHEKKWPLWGGACFAIILLGAFGQHLLALIIYAAGSDLHSYILLIPFVSGYLLYLRRDQLPKERFADLPFGIVLLACGVGVFLVTHWLDFAGRAPADNYHFVLLTTSFLCFLASGGFFFFGRAWMRAAAFPLAYLIFMVPMPDAMADTLETASKYASAEVANAFFHISGTPFRTQRSYLPTTEYHHRSCAGMQWHPIELGSFDDEYPGKQFVPKDAMAPVCTCRFRHSARHFAEWLSHPRDRPPLRGFRPTDDS